MHCLQYCVAVSGCFGLWLEDSCSTTVPQMKGFAYNNVLIQVFCCEVDGIFDALVNSSDLLAYLFSILEQARPLNSTRAGYFARVLASLLSKCSSPVMHFVQGNHSVVSWHEVLGNCAQPADTHQDRAH